jgi:DNA-binding transcriptional MerR regulator
VERRKSKYNIGDVCQICGISIRALRYYDKKGIFVPSLRDASSHYRYYSEEQILEALAIREMKLRGINVMEMQKTIGSLPMDSIDDILNKRKQNIKNEIDNLVKQLKRVENSHNLLRQALPAAKRNYDMKTREITVEEMPKKVCLCSRYYSRIFVEEVFWDRFADIYKLLDKYDYIADGPIMGIFHEHYTRQFFFEDGDLEILLPVSGADVPGEHLREFGGFLTARTTFVGFYNNLLPVYVELIKWIEANNFEIVGDPIEEYIIDFTHGVSKEEYVTRVNFPVQRKEAPKP